MKKWRERAAHEAAGEQISSPSPLHHEGRRHSQQALGIRCNRRGCRRQALSGSRSLISPGRLLHAIAVRLLRPRTRGLSSPSLLRLPASPLPPATRWSRPLFDRLRHPLYNRLAWPHPRALSGLIPSCSQNRARPGEEMCAHVCHQPRPRRSGTCAQDTAPSSRMAIRQSNGRGGPMLVVYSRGIAQQYTTCNIGNVVRPIGHGRGDAH